MYSEDNQKNEHFGALKFFLLRLILIVIFILLLVWLVPWPDMSGLKSLQAQIFGDNITSMKEAAIPYFTTERLPQKVGDKVTLTLQEMLDLKLLTPFVDKNGNTCDLNGSYVTIEKFENEYVMKVNLKCSGEEDYILVHLGCYSYCTNTICEKKDDSNEPSVMPTPKPTVKPTTTPKPTVKPTVKPTPTPTPTPSPKPTPVAYEYEYKKVTPATYSEWSGWKVWSYSDKDNINWTNTDTYQIQDLGAKEVIIRYDTTTTETIYKSVVTHDVVVNKGTYSYNVCTKVSYFADSNNDIYQSTDWVNTNVFYQGEKPANDTLTTRWVFVGFDTKVCPETCTNHAAPIWRKQTRTATKVDKNNITATCDVVITRNIPVNIIEKKTETVTDTVVTKTTTPVKGYVKYYRDRSRNLLTKTTTTYTWGAKNDPKLISEGWVATGNSRTK